MLEPRFCQVRDRGSCKRGWSKTDRLGTEREMVAPESKTTCDPRGQKVRMLERMKVKMQQATRPFLMPAAPLSPKGLTRVVFRGLQWRVRQHNGGPPFRLFACSLSRVRTGSLIGLSAPPSRGANNQVCNKTVPYGRRRLPKRRMASRNKK